MSETSNDAFRNLSTGYRGALFSANLLSSTITNSIRLIVFFAKLYRAHRLDAGDYMNIKDFVKDTNGQYGIFRIPMKENGNTIEDINFFSTQLHQAGIHFCTLPNYQDGYDNPRVKVGDRIELKGDEYKGRTYEVTELDKSGIITAHEIARDDEKEKSIDESPKYDHDADIKINTMDSSKFAQRFRMQGGRDPQKGLYVMVDNRDLQKFQTFCNDYIKRELSGGEKEASDLFNFTDNKVSMISVHDKAAPDFEKALNKLGVNFARIMGDVTPNHTQFLVPSAQIQMVSTFLQQYYRDNPLEEDISTEKPIVTDVKEDTYMKAARVDTDEYVDAQMDAVKNDVSDISKEELSKEEKRAVTEINDVIANPDIKGDESIACRKYYMSEQYVPISIDASIVESKGGKNSDFICKVPYSGTRGKKDTEESLILPRKQVFRVENSDREKYIAFIDKDKPPLVVKMGNIGKDGSRGIVPVKYGSGADLIKHTNDLREKGFARLQKKAGKIVAANGKFPINAEFLRPIAPPIK